MQLLAPGLLVIFGLIFALGLVSGFITRTLPLSEPLLALITGAALGVLVFGPFASRPNPTAVDVIHELAEVTLAIALMTTALQVPHGYLRNHWRPVVILLGVGMVCMWIVTSGILSLAMGVPVLVAALLAGAITPTDPVLASTIVSGELAEENIAGRIRHLIIVESGANDGLAYGFVLLPLDLLAHSGHATLLNWLLLNVLWQVGGALLFGVVLGLAAGWLANWAFAAQATEHSSFLGITLALALLTLGALKLLQTDAILGVFSAGLAFSEMLNLRGHELERAEHVQEAVERFFILPVFIVLGAVLPFQQWVRLGWRAALVVLLVLAFRRIPSVVGLLPWLRPALKDRHEALFVGWFGPIGISALFYITLLFPSALGGAVNSVIWPLGTLLIVASIVAHGVTATSFTRAFGRRTQMSRTGDDSASPEEQQEALVQDIEEQVRDEVRQATQAAITAIIERHLSKSGEESNPQMRSVRREWLRQARDSYGPEYGSKQELGEAAAHDIAHGIADELANEAARSVAEQVNHTLGDDEDKDDQDAENERHDQDEATGAAARRGG